MAYPTKIATIALVSLLSISAHATPAALNVTVENMAPNSVISERYTLCTPTADGKSEKVKGSLRPTIRWSGVPKDTASIAVFMMDPDVPADFTDADKEGKTLPEHMKRMDFYHYGVVDLPATATELAGGDAATPPTIGTELVNDLGLNGYVDPKSRYGGPCPPWNDERLHHYHFIVLALDNGAPISVPGVGVGIAPADRSDTAKNTFYRLIDSKYLLAKGAAVGTYTLNPKLRK